MARFFGLQLVPSLPSAPIVTELPVTTRPPAEEMIHLLVIELPSAGADFALRDEIAWCAEAGAQGASLVVLQSEGRLELYSTERDRESAFRPVLKSLAAQARRHPELRRARTVAKGGSVAALHLLRRAAGLEASATSDQRFIVNLHMSTATSAASLALGPSLASLFRAAANAHRRVRQETVLGDPSATSELREIEQASAERIVEEELLAWQAQEAEVYRAVEQARLYRAVESAKPEVRAQMSSHAATPQTPFAEEAPSAVRLRVQPSEQSKHALASSDE